MTSSERNLEMNAEKRRPVNIETDGPNPRQETNHTYVLETELELSDDAVEFFEGWKPLSPLQLVVEEVISE
ncbi:hypothetical protein Tco_1555318 [Tanacetum coccineum]